MTHLTNHVTTLTMISVNFVCFFNFCLSVLFIKLIIYIAFVVSFMKGFKRKEHSSLLKHLKTHCKFSLIETFLETLTDSSKQVMLIVCLGCTPSFGGIWIRISNCNHSDHGSTSKEIRCIWLNESVIGVDSSIVLMYHGLHVSDIWALILIQITTIEHTLI